MTGPAVDELNSALNSERDRASIAALHNFLADDFLGKLENWLNCLLQFHSWNILEKCLNKFIRRYDKPIKSHRLRYICFPDS